MMKRILVILIVKEMIIAIRHINDNGNDKKIMINNNDNSSDRN
jgi:hypothetical protein